MEQPVKNSNQVESPSKSIGDTTSSSSVKDVKLSFGEKIALVAIVLMLMFMIYKKTSSSVIDLMMHKYPTLYTEECLNKHGYTKEANQKYISLKKYP